MMLRVGDIYEELGERERALEYIGRALELGYPPDDLEHLPGLEDLSADPRFEQLLNR